MKKKNVNSECQDKENTGTGFSEQEIRDLHTSMGVDINETLPKKQLRFVYFDNK